MSLFYCTVQRTKNKTKFAFRYQVSQTVKDMGRKSSSLMQITSGASSGIWKALKRRGDMWYSALKYLGGNGNFPLELLCSQELLLKREERRTTLVHNASSSSSSAVSQKFFGELGVPGKQGLPNKVFPNPQICKNNILFIIIFWGYLSSKSINTRVFQA